MTGNQNQNHNQPQVQKKRGRKEKSSLFNLVNSSNETTIRSKDRGAELAKSIG